MKFRITQTTDGQHLGLELIDPVAGQAIELRGCPLTPETVVTRLVGGLCHAVLSTPNYVVHATEQKD